MLHDIVNRNLVSAGKETSIEVVANLMKEHSIGAVLILEDQIPVGIVTDRDIVIRCVCENRDTRSCKAVDVMTPTLHYLSESDGLFECITRMRDAKVRRMPVVDIQGKALGIISMGDLLAILSKEFFDLSYASTRLGDLLDEDAAKAA